MVSLYIRSRLKKVCSQFGETLRRPSIEASPYRARASRHPGCAASVASRHSLMAHPPLLCEEGNITRDTSLLKAGVNRLNEHRCGPRPGVRAKARVVVGGDSRGQDLLESRTFTDNSLDSIADDDHHVSIFSHLPFIREASMARDDHRPAFLAPRDGLIEDVIQRGNLPTETAAGPHINKWITCRIEDVTRDDHIQAAEVTMLLPSVVALGWQKISTASPL